MWNFIFNIIIFIVSILALIKGSSLFITQSTAIARRYKIPEFLIGITIVAFGTSLPELVISIMAAINGNSAITTSNVIGSSIANIGFILAITAMFGAIKINKSNLKFDIPLSVVSVIIFLIILYFTKGQVNWIVGLVLLLIFAIYSILVYKREKKNCISQSHSIRSRVSIPLFLLSLLLITVGGKYSVDSAVKLSELLNISQGFVGFTILAIGSSLPELIVSIIALRKGEYALSLGNIIGSNFFNLFFIIGLSSFITTLSFQEYMYELVILIMYNLALIVAALIGKKFFISRREGLFLFISYLTLIMYLYYR